MSLENSETGEAILPGGSLGSVISGSQSQLSELNLYVGKIFYQLAECLKYVSGGAHDIIRLGQEAKVLASEGESARGIALLSGILQDAKRIQRLTEISHEQLQKVPSLAHESSSRLTRLAKLPPLLRTVASLSRIEGSRLKNTAVDAERLAGDVDHLGTNIDQHVTAITDDVHHLAVLVSRGLDQLVMIEHEESAQSLEVINRSRDALAPLLERSEASKHTASLINEEYKEIHRELNKIVVSLQSEDIARQRIEHIATALDRISAVDPDLDEQVEQILVLQRSQFIATHQFVVKALLAIFDSLDSLMPRAENLVAQAKSLLKETENTEVQLGESSAADFDSLSSILARYAASASTTVSTIEGVLTSVEGMTANAKRLEGIESEIRLTAMNTSIQIAGLGHEGAPMRAIAREVHRITEQSNGDTHAVLNALHQMRQALIEISNEGVTFESLSSTIADGGAVIDGITRLTDTIRKSNAEMAATLEAMIDLISKVEGGLRCTCELRERCGSVEQKFDEVLQQIDFQLAQIGYAAGDRKRTNSEESVTDLSKLYSMHSEREIHEQIFGSAKNSTEVVEDSAPRTILEDDLGDNVELF